MVKMVDIQIGKLIAYLENTNQRDNTLILITSDNGASAEQENLGNGTIGAVDKYTSTGLPWALVSNTPFRKWKKTNYEGGINSPLIVNWPDGLVNTGRIVRDKLHFIDLMPTLIKVCNARYKFEANNQYVTAMQGEDFSTLFNDDFLPVRSRPLFFKWQNHEAMIFNDKKIVYNLGLQDWELYDLENDATETINLASYEPVLSQSYINEYSNWFASVTQASPVAVYDTLSAVYNNISFLNVYANDFDSDGKIDFSKTRITKQPNFGIINSIDDSLMYYQHFEESYISDTFEYVVYDTLDAFSQACQVIINICQIEDSCAILLQDDNFVFGTTQVEIFPNPAKKDLFFFVYNNPEISKEEINMYNNIGQKIDNYQVEKLTFNKFKLDLSALNSGYYFLNTPYKTLKIVVL